MFYKHRDKHMIDGVNIKVVAENLNASASLNKYKIR